MILLIATSFLCFITAFIHHLVKPVYIQIWRSFIASYSLDFAVFQIVSFLLKPSWQEKRLLSEISDLKRELEGVSMRKEYTNYVKMERKINDAQMKLTTLRSGRQTRNLAIQYGVPYGMQLLLSLALFVVSVIYRYTPVITLDTKQFDLVPFGPLIRFPTGIDGAISVPFWIFVCSFVSRHASSYV